MGFSSSVVPEAVAASGTASIPSVGVIDGFRWALLKGQAQLYIPGFLLSLAVAAVMLWIGVAYFRKTERTFADLL